MREPRIRPQQIPGPRIIAWARITTSTGACTVDDGYGVASVARGGTGRYTVTLTSPLLVRNALATPRNVQDTTIATVSYGVGTFGVVTDSHLGTADDRHFTVMVVG